MSFDAPSLFVAALISSAGLWWFNMVLKSVRTMASVTRYGIYLLVWLAYFVVVLMIIQQTGR